MLTPLKTIALVNVWIGYLSRDLVLSGANYLSFFL